jgi:hypothetical protein
VLYGSATAPVIVGLHLQKEHLSERLYVFLILEWLFKQSVKYFDVYRLINSPGEKIINMLFCIILCISLL